MIDSPAVINTSENQVLEVDNEGAEVLVHFAGWNGRWISLSKSSFSVILNENKSRAKVISHYIAQTSRHDEWIKMDSPRLQPYTRRSSRRRQSTGDNSGSEGR